MPKSNQITSKDNALLKKIRSLDTSAGRDESGLFLIEGAKLIAEALEKKFDLVDIVASQSFFESNKVNKLIKSLTELTVVNDKIFQSLCTTDSSCGILATAKRVEHSLEEILAKKNKTFIFGDCIQDPGNLGTIIRTALAFNSGGLILSNGSVDYLSPKVVRASRGAVLSLPIVADQDAAVSLTLIKSKGIRLVALDARAQKAFDQDDFTGSSLYIFGNEGHGLSQPVLDQVDKTLSIPINSLCESLNVAIAMGIILCQTSRRQS